MKISSMNMVAVAFLAAAATMVGCESTKKAETKASPSVMNANCPFSKHAVSPDATVAYKDGTVGFCCKDCVAKWGKMSDADRDAALAGVK